MARPLCTRACSWLGRLMSNKLCMDASMYMLMIVAKMYVGLLNDEQIDVNNAEER